MLKYNSFMITQITKEGKIRQSEDNQKSSGLSRKFGINNDNDNDNNNNDNNNNKNNNNNDNNDNINNNGVRLGEKESCTV